MTIVDGQLQDIHDSRNCFAIFEKDLAGNTLKGKVKYETRALRQIVEVWIVQKGILKIMPPYETLKKMFEPRVGEVGREFPRTK